MYLLVEKYTDYPIMSPVRLSADNGHDAYIEAFQRFEGIYPSKVEFFKVYKLTDEGEMDLRATLRTERDVIDPDELEELLQPAGTL